MPNNLTNKFMEMMEREFGVEFVDVTPENDLGIAFVDVTKEATLFDPRSCEERPLNLSSLSVTDCVVLPNLSLAKIGG